MPVKFNFGNPQMRTWMLIHQAYNSIARSEDKQYSQIRFSAQQQSILMAIKFSGGPVTPTMLADWVDRHLNSITLIVGRMEKSGLIKRVRNQMDRRSFFLVMTPKGEDYLREGIQRGWELIQNILSGLTPEEMNTLSNLLEKVRLKAIDRYYDDKTIREIDLYHQEIVPKSSKTPSETEK